MAWTSWRLHDVAAMLAIFVHLRADFFAWL
jgi:hypothetical protein